MWFNHLYWFLKNTKVTWNSRSRWRECFRDLWRQATSKWDYNRLYNFLLTYIYIHLYIEYCISVTEENGRISSPPYFFLHPLIRRSHICAFIPYETMVSGRCFRGKWIRIEGWISLGVGYLYPRGVVTFSLSPLGPHRSWSVRWAQEISRAHSEGLALDGTDFWHLLIQHGLHQSHALHQQWPLGPMEGPWH